MTLVLVAATTAACNEDTSTKARPGSTASSTETPAAEPQPITIKGAGAPLSTLVDQVYNGKDLAAVAAPDVIAAMAERQAANAPVDGEGSLGTWKGTRIAVVTVGRDVTLAVREGGWKLVGGWWPSLGLPKPYLGGVRRVLAIGGDARQDPIAHPHAIAAGTVVEKSRADSLHIIGFDGKGGAGMLGLARDFLAELTTGGPKQKINGAMAVRGPQAQVATVTKFTGVPLQGYVLVGFSQYMQLIDIFGPLRIFLEKPVKISDYVPIIPSGRVELAGEEALHLARARKHVEGGDFGRSHQQGRIMLAAAAMAKALGPKALPDFLTKASPYLWTDLSAGQMLTLIAHIYSLMPLKVPNEVAKGAETKVDGRYVVIADDEARRLFEDIKDGNLTPTP